MNVPFTQNNGGQPRKPFNWLQIFGAALVVLFVLGGLFWGGQWTYDQLAKSTPPDEKNTGTTSTQKPGEKEPVATNDSKKSQTKSSTSSNKLLNTGPGDTVAIFAVAVLAGSAAYQLKLRKET
jgi:hypothetical protein